MPSGVYRELLIESLATAVGLTAPKLEKMIAGGPPPSAGGTQRFAAAAKKPRHSPGVGRPSMIRRAITLVLNHPEAGRQLETALLQGLNRPGADLLRALIETVQSEPTITTAGLLERWRHDEQGRFLGRLAAAEIPLDEDFDAAAELAECLQQLALAGRKERIDFLIEKQRLSGLSDDEKSELRRLN